MKKNHFQKIIVATLLALSFVGCAKGLQTLDSSEASDSTGNSSQGTGTPTTPTAPAIDQVDMTEHLHLILIKHAVNSLLWYHSQGI